MAKETKPKPFDGVQCPQITIYDVGDEWWAVYVNGKLLHHHDRMDAEDFLHLLGIPVESVSLRACFTDAQVGREMGEPGHMPQTLKELQARIKKEELNVRRSRLAQLKRDQELVEREIDKLQKEEP